VVAALVLLVGLTPGAVTPVVAAAPASSGEVQASVAQPAEFTDVPAGVSFAQGVQWLVSQDITQGFGGSGLYSPAVQVNRGQMALFLWRMIGKPSPTAGADCGFGDMGSAPADMQLAACWLKQQEVTTGTRPGEYNRVGTVTRAQMARFLWRLAGKPDAALSCGFSDVRGDDELRRATCWLKESGITTGTNPAGTLYSQATNVTRGQMAAFLFRQAANPGAWEPQALTPSVYVCEVLDPRSCLLPFPSNQFTVADDTTDTGLRLDISLAASPSNKDGRRIDTTEQNRNDGFSPGQQLLVYLPDVDLADSGAAPITNKALSVDEDTPVVIINADTGELHPHWVEYDLQASDVADRLLMVLPARNFDEGARYLVAMRNLLDTSGNPVEANEVFAAYRDNTPTDIAVVEDRRDAMESLLGEFEAHEYDTSEFVVAWDFTVASQRNLAERMLHIRDDGFATLNGNAPTLVSTRELVSGEDDDFRNNVTTIDGVFEAPNYQRGPAPEPVPDGSPNAPAQAFNWGPDGLPERNPAWPSVKVTFRCVVPRDASAADPASMAIYGHGLLQDFTQVTNANIRRFANEHNVMFCATNWAGFSSADLDNAIIALQDGSYFNLVADGSQQGILNVLMLGRLMIHPDGLSTNPLLRDGSEPLVDRTRLGYDSNSQGGIMGGALMAVAQDFTRGVLGVPGMNYSVLLRRSSQWVGVYDIVFNSSYPNEIDRPQAFGLIQILWDRAEANGYAHHLTDNPLSVEGYEPTPAKQVMLHAAYADWQVANVTTDVLARTAGIKLFDPPALNPDRPANIGFTDRLAVEPFWGIERISAQEIADGFGGSAYVMWDSGNRPPPTGNIPPGPDLADPDPVGDSHGKPRDQRSARTQKAAFLSGAFVDVCNAAPCLAPG
jgi:hypothetical protein